MHSIRRHVALFFALSLFPALLSAPGAHAKKKKKAPSTNLQVLDAGSWGMTWKTGEASNDSHSWTTTFTVSGKTVQAQSLYSGSQPPAGGTTQNGSTKINDTSLVKKLLKKADSASGYDSTAPQLQNTTYEEACLRHGGKTRCATRMGSQPGSAAFDIMKELKSLLAKGLAPLP